jgi:hypothetical protein
VEVELGGARSVIPARREVVLPPGPSTRRSCSCFPGSATPTRFAAAPFAVLHTCPASAANLQDQCDVTQVMNAPKLRDLLGVSPSGALAI